MGQWLPDPHVPSTSHSCRFFALRGSAKSSQQETLASDPLVQRGFLVTSIALGWLQSVAGDHGCNGGPYRGARERR